MKKQFRPGDYTLKEAEVKLLINSQLNFRNRTILKAMYYGGLRREEVCLLHIEDVNFKHRLLRIIGKGDKERIVPFINMEFMGDLKQIIASRKRGYVFCKDSGEPLSLRMFNVIVEEAGYKAGITHPRPDKKHINPHLLRHSIARHLKNNRQPIEFIQNFLGHSNYQMTMDVYGRMGVDDMQNIADKLSGIIMKPQEEERSRFLE